MNLHSTYTLCIIITSLRTHCNYIRTHSCTNNCNGCCCCCCPSFSRTTAKIQEQNLQSRRALMIVKPGCRRIEAGDSLGVRVANNNNFNLNRLIRLLSDAMPRIALIRCFQNGITTLWQNVYCRVCRRNRAIK